MDKKIIKNYIFNTSYQILALILPLITTPYVSRCLGVENIGTYSFTASIVSYFVLFCTFSFNTYGQKEIAFNQNNERKRSQIFFEIQSRKALITIIALAVYALFIYYQRNYQVYYIIQSITIFATFWDISYFFQGLELYKITVIKNALVKIISVICIFVFVRDSNDLGIYILIQSISTLIGSITLWPYLKKFIKINYFKRFSLQKDFKIIFELFVPVLSVQMYFTIDKTMLGLMCNNTIENGYYEQALKIVRICQTVITSLGGVLISSVSRMISNNEKEKIVRTASDSISIGLFLAVPMSLGLISISKYFTPVFFGNGYDKVAIVLSILSMIVILSALSNIAGNAILIPTGRHNYLTAATLIAAIVNIILNSILIPRFMACGAAIASVISEIIVLIIQYYFARDYLNFKNIFISFLKYLFAGIMMFVLLKIISSFMENNFSDLVITATLIICGGIIYLLMMLVERNPFVMKGISVVKDKIKRS